MYDDEISVLDKSFLVKMKIATKVLNENRVSCSSCTYLIKNDKKKVKTREQGILHSNIVHGILVFVVLNKKNGVSYSSIEICISLIKTEGKLLATVVGLKNWERLFSFREFGRA